MIGNGFVRLKSLIRVSHSLLFIGFRQSSFTSTEYPLQIHTDFTHRLADKPDLKLKGSILPNCPILELDIGIDFFRSDVRKIRA